MRRGTFDRTKNSPPGRRKRPKQKKTNVKSQSEFEARVPRLTDQQLRFIRAFLDRVPGESMHQSLIRAMNAAGYAVDPAKVNGYYLLKYTWAGALLRALDDPAQPFDTRLLDQRLREIEARGTLDKQDVNTHSS